MKIRYENTVDDFVALALFHQEHSPTARRARARAMWFLAAIILALTTLMAIATAKSGIITVTVGVTAMLVTAGTGFLYLPRRFRNHLERQVRRMYNTEGENKSVLGAHELELIGNELVSRTTYTESRMRLEAIERVMASSTHTFIFVSATTAHVIPHDAVSEGNPEIFADAVSTRIGPRPF